MIAPNVAEILNRVPHNIDMTTFPTITVEPDVIDFDHTMAGPAAQQLVLMLAQNLELETQALLRHDASILVAVDHGDRLAEMQDRLRSATAAGVTTVDRYTDRHGAPDPAGALRRPVRAEHGPGVARHGDRGEVRRLGGVAVATDLPVRGDLRPAASHGGALAQRRRPAGGARRLIEAVGAVGWCGILALHMARDDERRKRASEEPIVGGLPDVPGIGTAIRLTPNLGVHLRGLADELLVNDFPGTTLQRHEREMLATAVSAANDCFFCMDSHGAFANALLEQHGATHLAPLLDEIKLGSSDGFDAKMQALLHIARTVGGDARDLTTADVAAAHAAGATDADVQLAVLIASAFSMYNRMVEGFRARTAPSEEAYRTRAGEIATHGYSGQPVTSGRE